MSTELQNINLDKFEFLSTNKKSILREIVYFLNVSEGISGVLFGGSLAYKEYSEKSDIDLFCLIENRNAFELNLLNSLQLIQGFDVLIAQGHFPWTGKLYTLYFKSDLDFSIDLCLVNKKDAAVFFWEPDGHIIFDKSKIIELNRNNQLKDPDFTRHPFLRSNPFTMSVITVKKIDKNLSRSHLWNSLEQMNILRRYLMQIYRVHIIKDNSFLGRVDRDIENVISFETNEKFYQTIASYDISEIARKTILLINLLQEFLFYLEATGEEKYFDWISTQLRHEKGMLANYCN